MEISSAAFLWCYKCKRGCLAKSATLSCCSEHYTRHSRLHNFVHVSDNPELGQMLNDTYLNHLGCSSIPAFYALRQPCLSSDMSRATWSVWQAIRCSCSNISYWCFQRFKVRCWYLSALPHPLLPCNTLWLVLPHTRGVYASHQKNLEESEQKNDSNHQNGSTVSILQTKPCLPRSVICMTSTSSASDSLQDKLCCSDKLDSSSRVGDFKLEK